MLMASKIVVGILFAVGVLIPRANAMAPTHAPETPKIALGGESEINMIIDTSAQKWGVNRQILVSVLKCESSLKPNAVGDSGTSFGIAQIRLIAHPEITKAEALDPAFAINYLAEQISLGRGYMWTCYRLIKGQQA